MKFSLKKVLSTILLSSVLIWAEFILPQTAFAAWGGTDGFESYTVAADLGGTGGGSGWGGNWTVGAGSNMTILTAVCNEASQCAGDKAGDVNIYRLLSSAVTSGVISFDMKSTSEGTTALELVNAGVTDSSFRVQATGGDINFRGATIVTLVSTQNNDWYTVEIDFRTGNNGCTTSQGSARAKPTGGSFGSWTSCVGEAIADDVSGFQSRFSFAVGRTLAIDDIKQGTVAAGGTTQFDMSPYNETLFFNNWL